MNRSVLVRTAHSPSAIPLAQLLSPLPQGRRSPEIEFVVQARGSGVALRVPGGAIRPFASLWDAFYALESWIYDAVLPSSRDCFILHAAGLVHRGSGCALILAGPSRCGKSSLALGLTAGGRFGYLSEEAVGLTLEGRVLPYPKPFRIRHGLERIVSGRPDWIHLGRTEAGIRYVLPPLDAVEATGAAPPLRFVLFPEFERDRESRLESLTRAETLARLATCTTNAPEFLGDHLRHLADVAAGLTAWRFRWNDLEEAMSCLERLIAAESQAPGRFD